ncbi:thiamine pyrophosphokinase [Biscogniauxia mediterranea]|nr:thiamine pyrophosphokinase [Biscogniauxia mediterranea]
METPESSSPQTDSSRTISDGEPYNIEWNPIRLFLADPGYSFALVILNQPIRDEALFRDLWGVAETRVAADGGANHVHELNIECIARDEVAIPGFQGYFTNLDTIIGDLDSLSIDTRHFFITHFPQCRIIQDPDQDSSDFTKAVRHVRREFPEQDIVCMGGLGGRVDQGLSQLHHLYMFQTSLTYRDGRMYLVSGESLTFLLKGGHVCHRIRVRDPDADFSTSHRLTGDPFAKYVGIIPIGGPSFITTRGLEWDVENWETEFGGQMSTSNHVLPQTEVVEVETTNDVLFTIAFKQVLDSHIRSSDRD